VFKRVVVGSAIAAASWYAFFRITTWRARWGVDPAEATRALPGDGLVDAPTAVDTRGITIDAPPEAVWPWLVQMGYGRGGWYSYDRLDMKGSSATEIRPELQSLAVGDTVPTDPGGGFVVRIIEPGRALVLGVDEEILARRTPEGTRLTAEAPGLAASGRFLEASVPPEFRAAWAFVVEPTGDGRTRLIERFSAWFGASTAVSTVASPLMGFGVFVMMRRQMLGIRDRAELLAAGAQRAVPAAPADSANVEVGPVIAEQDLVATATG
jgi:hypothetical protein